MSDAQEQASKAEEAATASVDTANKGKEGLAEEALKRAEIIVPNVNRFKQPRLDRIKKYRDLYAGNVPKKFRQPFNVVLPTFAGAMDTLMAAFNDDLALKFDEQEPADYMPVRKLNTLWNMESTSVAPTAKFNQKTREDRSNALFSGRGFMMSYAQSDPEYRNVFETYELDDAIFQPTGGSIAQLHLYNGRQNIIRSEAQLKRAPYDQAQVKKLLAAAARSDFDPTFEGTQEAKNQLAKFKAMGLSPESADYVGERLFKLVELRITMGGVRYYIVFSPWYQTWVRFDKFSDVFSADIDPWISWATHEDNRNFLSKSFADDMYSVADAIHIMFNQELTNREKKNFMARAFDKEMFPDVAALDRAQTRPDALVSADTKGGTRKISEGIYTFETAELGGTINLIDWTKQAMGQDVGVTDLSQGQSQGVGKKATVVLAEQNALSKRYILRASPYTESMGEIGKLFIQGCKDHLPARKALQKLGADGEDWDREIRRVDLDLYADVNVRVISSTLDMQDSQLKKKAKVDTLSNLAANPALVTQLNPKWLVAEMLRSGADIDDSTIDIAMDTKNYGNEVEVARAHEAIQAVQTGQKPDPFYGATTLFAQIIYDFAVNNRTSLGESKYNTLLDFLMAHAEVMKENMARKARIDAAAVPVEETTAAKPASSPVAPDPAAAMSQVSAQ